MALIVQDDSGDVIGANCYADLNFVDAYFSLRNKTSWDDLDLEIKEAAIIAATDYLDTEFSSEFKGSKPSREQGTQWPRNSAIDPDGFLIDGIPKELKNAMCEYAFRASSNELNPDLVQDESGQVLKSKRDKTDVLEEEFVYQDSGSNPVLKSRYPAADAYLKPLLGNDSNNFIVRA